MHDDVFRPGDLCGTYRIIKLLGRGGFADVYLAIDLTTQQRVALKCLQLRHLTNAQITQRMVAETELLADLDHPNVIQVEDAGINGGVLWLAMEYIAGGTLRERLRKLGGPLPPLAALKYARQIADGVGAAHGKQVVHRDLKPENIMITDRDEVKVLDLGAAKFFGKELTLTNAAGAIGTPLYMAPEQIKGEVVGVHTDVYALGTILYEMLAGRHPFAQPSGELPPAFELGALHLHAQPRPLSEIISGLPEHVWRVVERALAKDPARRYASMDELGKAIQNARRRLLDDPSAGKVVGAIPLRRAPQYAEPSDVAAANENHSGVRGVDEFMGAQPSVDILIDPEPPRESAAGDSGARGAERSARGEVLDPGALSFSELVAQSGEIEGDAERAVAGSGRVPRAPRRAVAREPALVEPAMEKSAAVPADVSSEVLAFVVAPEVFQTTRSAGPSEPTRALADLPAVGPDADALARDAALSVSGPITQRSRTGVTAPTASDVVPTASDVVPMLSDAAPTLTYAPKTLAVVAPMVSVAPLAPGVVAPTLGALAPSSTRVARSKATMERRAMWGAAILAGLIVVMLLIGFGRRVGESVAEQASSALHGFELDARLVAQLKQQVDVAAVLPVQDQDPTGGQANGSAQLERGGAGKRVTSPPEAPSGESTDKCKSAVLFASKDDRRCNRSGPSAAPSTASTVR